MDADPDNIFTGLVISLLLSERDRIELKGTILEEECQAKA